MAKITAHDPIAIRVVTMHPFVSGAKRYDETDLQCEGRKALLKIRSFCSRAARQRKNMAEDAAYGIANYDQPMHDNLKARLGMLRVAYADPVVPADLHEIIGRFLPEVNPEAQGA